jgi:hypothetical protein
VLFLAALVSVVTTLGIVYILVAESAVFFEHVPLIDFLTDTQWTPLFDDAHFGIAVLLAGTLVTTVVAAGGHAARHDHRDLPQRVRRAAHARDRQADAGAAGRRADRRLRLLRAAHRHAAAAEIHAGPARLQHARPAW